MSANNKNVVQDLKVLEKFIKVLALKSAQVIVQSRLGEKIHTNCNPHSSGNDWFNITIEDNLDVLAETKKVLNINAGESIANRLPLSIEISLQTVEGDKMILEVWSIGLIPDQADPTQRPTHTVYTSFSGLLKSLISVTRVTPAYKLSRRQSSDSYKIYYRIYVGEPQIHNLGDGYKQVRVGQLSTTFGALNISVAYRTKMTISPTHSSGRSNEIMVKSDHFHKDISPKHIRCNKKTEKKIIDLDRPMKIGAFVDPSKTKQYSEEDYLLPENPPFSWLLKKKRDEAVINDTNTINNTQQQQQPAVIPTITEDDSKCQSMSITNDSSSTSIGINGVTINTTNNNLGYESSNHNNSNNNTTSEQQNNKKNQNNNYDQSTLKPNCNITTTTTTITVATIICGEHENNKINKNTRILPPEDERLLKELHFPFATNNTPISDLAKFYRDCFNAPPLHAFNETPTYTESETTEIGDLAVQLEQFETSLGDYDTLVTSLCCQSVDNNSNS